MIADVKPDLEPDWFIPDKESKERKRRTATYCFRWCFDAFHKCWSASTRPHFQLEIVRFSYWGGWWVCSNTQFRSLAYGVSVIVPSSSYTNINHVNHTNQKLGGTFTRTKAKTRIDLDASVKTWKKDSSGHRWHWRCRDCSSDCLGYRPN